MNRVGHTRGREAIANSTGVVGTIWLGEREVRVVEAGADAAASSRRAPCRPRAARARSSRRTSSAGMRWRRLSEVELEQASRRSCARAAKSALQLGVALEAEHLDVVEEQAQHRRELVGLEQVHVERVLEVGRPVRGDHERACRRRVQTRASSATCCSGPTKCSMMCDEHTQSNDAVAERRARAPSIAANSHVGAPSPPGRRPCGRGPRSRRGSRRRRPGGRARRAAPSPSRRRSRRRAPVPGPSRAMHLAVPGVVEREQRVGGRTLHRALAGQFHSAPAPKVGAVR